MKLEQVDQLNERVKIKIAPSSIHGVGVFAIRDIAKGQRLYANIYPIVYDLPYSAFKQLFPEVRELLLEHWPSITEGARFAHPDTLFQSYMNHSDDPNYDNQTDLALRDIKAGEEITEDYKLIPGYEQVFHSLDFIKKE